MGKKKKREYCTGVQYYKGIPLTLIVYTEAHFAALKAKRFMLGDTKYNQNVWIPNAFLDETGRIQPWADIDFVMRQAYRQHKFEYARIKINPFTWKEEEV